MAGYIYTMSSTKATQKFRSDPEKKFNENRDRQIKRIFDGFKPRQQTLETYKISMDEVNAIRKKGGHSPLDTKESIKTISEWMILNDDKMSESTKKLHFGTLENYTNSNLYRILKDKDVSASFKDMKATIESIISKGSPATMLRNLQTLSLVMEKYPGLEKYEKQFNLLKKVRNELSGETQASNLERRQAEKISDTFTQIKQKVCEKFGEDSKECLYMKFYEEVPSRDDLGSVDIHLEDPERTDDNYIIVGTGDRVTFVLNKYKTSEIYGQIKTNLSKKLSEEIRNYIIREKPVYLFGKGKMSTFVGKMLKDLGVEGSGNITLLRKAFVSEKFENDPNMSSEDRVALAKALKHSPLATTMYIRKFK